MHVTRINEKRGHKFIREKGGIWKDLKEKKKGDDGIQK